MYKNRITICLILALCVHIFAVLILSSVPPVSRDALTHHLAVPKLYLKNGGIYEIPEVKFSYYPMNLDLLYMIPLYFGSDIAPKYIHFSFALLTACLIFVYLKKRLNSRYGLLGALFFLTIPIIVKLSITVYVDLGLIFFSTASIVLILKWFEQDGRQKHLFLSAICCGLALGTKYNGLVTFFLLTLFVLFLSLRLTSKKQSSSIAINGILFFVVSIMFFSPWMIRNYIWKSNPIYPLNNPIGKFLKSDKKVTVNSTDRIVRLDHFSIRRHVYNESWWETSLIPVRIFFQGKDNDPKYFDGKLTPFLLILPLFTLYRKKLFFSEGHILEIKVWLSFAGLFLLFAFVNRDMRIRYIAPIIPTLIILSMFGFYRLSALLREHLFISGKKAHSYIMVLLVCIMIGLNTHYVWWQFGQVKPFSFLSGRIGREEYIEKHRPEFVTMNYANKKLPNNIKILALFLGNRRYYCDQNIVFQNNYFLRIVKKSSSADDIFIKINKNQFTHLMIGWTLFSQWVEKNFDPLEKKMITQFIATKTKLLISKSGYGLFELASPNHQ